MTMNSTVSENAQTDLPSTQEFDFVPMSLVMELPLGIVNDKFLKDLSNHLIAVFELKMFNIDDKWFNQKDSFKGVVKLTPPYTDNSTGITYGEGQVCTDGGVVYKTGTSQRLVAVHIGSLLPKDYTQRFKHMCVLEHLFKLFWIVWNIRPNMLYGKTGQNLMTMNMADVNFHRSMYMDYMVEQQKEQMRT